MSYAFCMQLQNVSTPARLKNSTLTMLQDNVLYIRTFSKLFGCVYN